MKKVLFFINFILLASVQIAFSQPPAVKTSVDRTAILIGEHIKYHVEVSFPINTYRIGWFNVPDSFDHFEIVSRGKVDTAEDKGILTYKQILTVTSFDSGIYSIPSQPITFEPDSGDSSFTIFTDSIPINISYSPLDSSKTFHDIKNIIEVTDETPLWMWVAGGLLIFLIIIALIYLIKYLRRKKPKALFDSKLSPFDEAMQSLSFLQNENLLIKGNAKQFHTSLAEIFKRYLSRKLQKNMLNHTSSEVLLLLNDFNLSKENMLSAATLLRMTDAVKFAKYIPPASESESALMNTHIVIEEIEKIIFSNQNKQTN